MPVKYVTLSGGLDLEIPPIEAPSGKCLEAYNYYESVKGGYTTLLGYEKFDGLPPPSQANYHYILIDDWDLVTPESVNIAIGQTLVIGSITVTIVATEVSPTGDQVIIIGGEAVGVAPSLPVAIGGSPSVIEITSTGYASTTWETGGYASYLLAAQDARRVVISPVPGDGAIRGVEQINDELIAWRDDGADLKAYKSSAASWVEIPLAAVYEVNTSGLTVATVGDLCNGGQDKIIAVHEYLTGGAPDTNKRVYVVKRISGGVPTGFVNDVGAVNHGSVLGTVAWLPAGGGTVDAVNHNFYAGLDTYNMYYADGVNCAMSYAPADNVIAPISADYRVIGEVCGHVISHNQLLIMGTTGGTYLTSAAGDPEVLDAFVGAHEIGVGDDITGFRATSSEDLAIFTRNQTHVVKGRDASDWVKRIGSKNSGARSNCIAQIDDVFASDDRGIARLSRTDALGGFNAATITDDVQTLFNEMSSEATCATTFRALNQMRFYYGNRFLICSRVPYNANGNEGIRYGITEGGYPIDVLVVSTDEDLTGTERSFFGSTDGYVYEMDKGSSFDGVAMEQILTLHYNHLKSPLNKKRFVGADLEAITKAPCTFTVYYSMNDGLKTFNPRTVFFPGSAGSWDVARYDEGVFDAAPLSRPRMGFKGTGYNFQLSFHRNSATEPQATLTGYALRYRMRGQVEI